MSFAFCCSVVTCFHWCYRVASQLQILQHVGFSCWSYTMLCGDVRHQLVGCSPDQCHCSGSFYLRQLQEARWVISIKLAEFGHWVHDNISSCHCLQNQEISGTGENNIIIIMKTCSDFNMTIYYTWEKWLSELILLLSHLKSCFSYFASL